MAFLDTLIGDIEEAPQAAQKLYNWTRLPQLDQKLNAWSGQPGSYDPARAGATPPFVPPRPASTNPPVMPAPAPATPPAQPVDLGPAAAPTVAAKPLQPVDLGPQAQPAMPGPPPQAKPGLGAKLAAVGIGLTEGIKPAIDYYRGVKDQPITDYNTEVARGRQQIQDEQTADKTAAQVARDQAEAANQNAEAQNRRNPPAKTRPIVVAGPNGEPTPALQNMETDEITDQHGTPIPNAQMWEKPAAPAKLNDEEQAIQDEIKGNPKIYPGGDIASNRVKARVNLKAKEAAAGRDPNQKGDQRADRSYQFSQKELDEERKTLEGTMSKISAATSNIDLKSPQADALLAPQILSLSAGGTGSGLRMNEAEISRILGGRTVWEGLQASANKWSTDPNHPAIPEAQRAQMVQILQAATQKGQTKQAILEWGEGRLVDTDDPKAMRSIVADTRKLLDAVDSGKRIQHNRQTGEYRIAPEQ